MRQRLPPLTCNQACRALSPPRKWRWGVGSSVASAGRRQAVAVSTRMPCAQCGVSGVFHHLAHPQGLRAGLCPQRSLPQRAKGVETTPTPLSLGQGLCSEAGVPCGSDLASAPTCWVSATSAALYPARSPCPVASCSAFILPSLWPPANPSSTSTLTPSCSHLCSPAATRALCLLPQTFSAKEAALEILRE